MTNIHNLGITHTEYAQLLAQGYDPNKRTPVDRAWREHRRSKEASASSRVDQRQTTGDRRGVARVHSSVGGYLRWFSWKVSDCPYLIPRGKVLVDSRIWKSLLTPSDRCLVWCIKDTTVGICLLPF